MCRGWLTLEREYYDAEKRLGMGGELGILLCEKM
jgi:hypothetical protein